MIKQENFQEEIDIKIGPSKLNFKAESALDKIFTELVADYVNKRFNENQIQQIDTIKTYAYTLLEIAKEKINLEKKVEEKIDNLETKISFIIEKISSCLSNQ